MSKSSMLKLLIICISFLSIKGIAATGDLADPQAIIDNKRYVGPILPKRSLLRRYFVREKLLTEYWSQQEAGFDALVFANSRLDWIGKVLSVETDEGAFIIQVKSMQVRSLGDHGVVSEIIELFGNRLEANSTPQQFQVAEKGIQFPIGRAKRVFQLLRDSEAEIERVPPPCSAFLSRN